MADHLDRFPGLLALGLQADLEGAGLAHRGKVAVDAVDEAALVADFLDQARDEAAAAEGVIADQQREEVGMAALDGRQAEIDVGLAGRVCQRHRAGAGGARRLRQVRRGAGRQGQAQLLGDGLGFGPRQLADHGDAGVAGGVQAPVEIDQVVAGQRCHAVRRRLATVGMIRVQRFPESLAGNAVGAGHRILEAGDGAGLFALQDGGVEMRLAQHVGEHGQRRWQLVGGGQGAQRDAGAVGVGAAAEAGAEVGQLLGDCRFVARAGAEVEDATGQRGQPGLVGRIEHRAGGEVDLHVEHGQRRCG